MRIHTNVVVNANLAFFFIILMFPADGVSQINVRQLPAEGYEKRIKDYVDSLRIIDSHEHLADPKVLNQLNFLDFMLLFHQYNYNDLVSAGLSPSHYDELFNQRRSPSEKWEIIEPFWENSFNTTYNRIAILAAQKLYNVEDINRKTIDTLSRRISRAYYQTDWVNHVLKNLCRIDYIIQDGKTVISGVDNILYVKRFTDWLVVRSKSSVDSIAKYQGRPITTLEDFVASIEGEFKDAMNSGIVAVKVNLAYYRTLKIDNPGIEDARKIFRSLRNGEDRMLTHAEAKPLQDYMFHVLMKLAQEYKMPVVIHAGIHSGNGNYIANANPTLLTDIFIKYPKIKFALFHGGYPWGGEVSVLAKNFPNVYIDLNWIYAISPSFSERYLHEWLETIPVSKIMAFGGDFRCAENIYGQLLIARHIIATVLIKKVSDGYFSEQEAITVAKMMLYDNAKRFYNIT